MFIRHVLSSPKAAGDANRADLQPQLVPLKARLWDTRAGESDASDYNLNSIYRIIVFALAVRADLSSPVSPSCFTRADETLRCFAIDFADSSSELLSVSFIGICREDALR
ncbi:hypothetical protein EOS_39855 [Caballeronia mineralivorans PML1(12)]|uniref:Uncharacterized protein n=1 Tax=Caballeronia mineralivorans PML1(12) TaxID=908627 RepID=A0A0J1CJ06_9BURK|nr:hypothetical protein EOS_39855 [Caballeronia mineralivorans PML1(12)]